jgi:hypothetical protein
VKEFKPISGLLKNSYPISKDPPVDEFLQNSLVEYWNEHAGIAAAHTYPLLFQSGRMVVFCDSAVWATQIRHQKPSLLRQLNDSNFTINDISPKIRPVSSLRPQQGDSSNKMNPLSEKNSNEIRNLASSIGHSGLRKSLIHLAKRTKRGK